MAIFITPGAFGTASATARFSSDGINWQASTLPSSGSDWFVAGYINNTYVAVIRGSSAYATSTDGINWTSRTLPAAGNWKNSSQSGGAIVICGESTSLKTTDGINWTSGSISNASGSYVFWSGTHWITCVDNSSNYAYSTDGITWTTGNLPGNGGRGCTNGVYCVILKNDTHTYYWSSDHGITWTEVTITGPSSNAWGITAKNGGTFVTTYTGATSYYTNDITSASWTAATMPSSQLWRDVGYDQIAQKFVTFDYLSSTAAYSGDGVTWTAATTNDPGGNQNWDIYAFFLPGTVADQVSTATSNTEASFSYITFTPQIFQQECTATSTTTALATTTAITGFGATVSTSASTTLQYSQNHGESFSTKTMPAAYVTRRSNGNYWLGLVNGSSSVGKSTDAYTYTNLGNNITSSGWWALEWSPDLQLWCAGSGTGLVRTSPDGVTWTTQTPSIASQNWNGLAWGNGLFVMTGRTSANFMTSPDGVNWTTRNTGVITGVWNDCIWTGQNFVTCDQNTTTRVLISPDGINWTQKTVTSGSYWFMAHNGNGTVVLARDNSNLCAVSTDHGETWSNATLPASRRWGVTGVAWDGTKFVMGAYSSTGSAVSTDGLTWTAKTMTSGTYTGAMRSSWVYSAAPPPPTFDATKFFMVM